MSDKLHHQILIIGAGAGGIATAASLLKRNSQLDIAIIDSAEKHYYQPGWTMVGGGIFNKEQTQRPTKELIPPKARWIEQQVTSFDPDNNQLSLDNGATLSYDYLVVSPGLSLRWDKVKGLEEALGKNGVTSNYRYDLAPYTWELVQSMESGKAIFTQPAMPIKCAGAPQKAMYLSCSHWLKQGVLDNINVSFHNQGGALFGVADYVPALMKYVAKYNAELCFNQNLIEIDGENKIATFEVVKDGKTSIEQQSFDMIHVCPPQSPPDFIAQSSLANQGGWLDLNQHSLQHNHYANIFGLGDVSGTPNAKTAAAVRKQAPIVANNLIKTITSTGNDTYYKGYGSCPLTVEHGKIVLAEFGYGGQLQPTLPKWIINGLTPTWAAWFLKASILPYVYWNAMLKGKEWLVKPDMVKPE